MWNVKAYEYRNRVAKEQALLKMVEDLKVFNDSVTTAVRNKIHTLRSQFDQERKLQRESIKSGAGTDQVYTPKLWCFDFLMFINDGDELRQSTSTLSESIQPDASNAVSIT